jgi:hypothetical protein
MKTIELKAYEFSELNEKAKDKVLQEYCSLNVDDDWWWEFCYEDFNTLGLKVNSFDIYRQTIDIEFKNDIKEFCNNIVNSWNDTDMLNICNDYLANGNNTNKENESYYKKLIAEEVLTSLTNEYDYLISEEAVIERIEANEYYFNEEGININNII